MIFLLSFMHFHTLHIQESLHFAKNSVTIFAAVHMTVANYEGKVYRVWIINASATPAHLHGTSLDGRWQCHCPPPEALTGPHRDSTSLCLDLLT